jgi:TRAP-type C4-dicarboxylate transport system permease small subunit
MLVYLVFLGSGLAMIEDKHIRVDFILNQFPPKIRKWVELFNNLVTIAFCLVMVYAGFVLVQKTGTQMVSTLRKYFNMPMAWWNSAIMVGGVIMAAAVCAKLWRKEGGVDGNEEKEDP